MTNHCDNTSTSRPGRWDHRLYPGLPGQIRIQPRTIDGDPVAYSTVQARIDTTMVDATPDGDDWIVTLTWPTPAVLPLTLLLDGVVATTGTVQVGRVGECDPSTDPVTVTTGGDTVLNVTVLGVGGPGGGGLPPQAGDGIEVVGYTVSVDATVVRDGDARLTDARVPLPHTHPVTDVTGLAAVATTGDYGDLSGAPTIPSTPGDVGADPAGAADAAVQGHVAASDPHGDRAYTDSAVAALDADDVGAVPVDGLPARIEGDGTTTTVTGAGTPADPLVVSSLGGGGGGGGAPDASGWRETWTPGVMYPAHPMLRAPGDIIVSTTRRGHAVPLLAPAGAVIDAVSIEVTTGGDDQAVWITVWSSQPAPDGSRSPDEIVAVLGSVPADTTGWKTLSGLDWTIPSGDLWICISSIGGSVRYRGCDARIPEWVRDGQQRPDLMGRAGRVFNSLTPAVDPSDPDNWPTWGSPATAAEVTPLIYLTAGEP